MRRVELPEHVEDAAISADGALLVVSTCAGDEEPRVLREERGQWVSVRTPDMLWTVTDLRCATDGQSFAYAYLTEQPWNDFGRYGSRMYGAAVFAADGTVLGEEWVEREFDEAPHLRVAWGVATGASRLV